MAVITPNSTKTVEKLKKTVAIATRPKASGPNIFARKKKVPMVTIRKPKLSMKDQMIPLKDFSNKLTRVFEL